MNLYEIVQGMDWGGIQHIIYFDYIVTLIPAWMPAKVGLGYLVIARQVECGNGVGELVCCPGGLRGFVLYLPAGNG
jgi:hypothetical protein